MECLQRQVDELQAVLAMFPEEGSVVLQPAEQDNFNFAVKVTLGESTFQPEDVPLLSGTVQLLDVTLNGAPVGLRFVLPRCYPDLAPQISVECAGPRSVHEQLSAVVRETAAAHEGSECLLLALDALKEAAEKLQTLTTAEVPSHFQPVVIQVMRVLVWFHHIKSTTKRKHIVDWARELDVCGACKPGFPGLLVAEGLKEDVEEYLQRLRSLSWQAMQIRGQEVDTHDMASGDAACTAKSGASQCDAAKLAQPLPVQDSTGCGCCHILSAANPQCSHVNHAPVHAAACSNPDLHQHLDQSEICLGKQHTHLKQTASVSNQLSSSKLLSDSQVIMTGPHLLHNDMKRFCKWNFQGFVELEETGMSQLSQMCRDSGLEHLFLTALKISKE